MARKRLPRPQSQAVPPEVRKEWGANIARARKRAGFPTQESLAVAIGRTRAAVSLWECGLCAPSFESQRRIAEALGRSPATLFPIPIPA